MEQKLDPNQHRKIPRSLKNQKSQNGSYRSESESSMLASTKASEFDSKIRSHKTGYIEDTKGGYQISSSSMEKDMIQDDKENRKKDAKKYDKQDPDSILRRKERKKRRKAKRRKRLRKAKGEISPTDSEPDDETKHALQMREILKGKQHVDDVDPEYDDWKKKNLAIFKEENPFRVITDINYTELVGHIIEVYTFLEGGATDESMEAKSDPSNAQVSKNSNSDSNSDDNTPTPKAQTQNFKKKDTEGKIVLPKPSKGQNLGDDLIADSEINESKTKSSQHTGDDPVLTEKNDNKPADSKSEDSSDSDEFDFNDHKVEPVNLTVGGGTGNLIEADADKEEITLDNRSFFERLEKLQPTGTRSGFEDPASDGEKDIDQSLDQSHMGNSSMMGLMSPNKDPGEKIESGKILESKSKGDKPQSDKDGQKSDIDAQKSDEDPPQLTEEDLKHDEQFLKSLDYLTLILPVAFSQKHVKNTFTHLLKKILLDHVYNIEENKHVLDFSGSPQPPANIPTEDEFNFDDPVENPKFSDPNGPKVSS
jgi:hypothetical protein